MNEERRRFSRSEKAAMFLAADGRCANPDCRRELDPGWHADHVNPYAAGGPTDVINGQALCPECNLRKGYTVDDLRAWQKEALRDFNLWQPQDNKGFLVEATPGAGKTRYAIEVSRRLLDAGRISRVVIAVPTARLETQWAEEFAAFGININPNWHAADGTLASDEHGCAATYAEIANSAQSYRMLASRRPSLVILDEIHHCGRERSWGTGIWTAFEHASVKLLLSGTPFRSDNNEIPFVHYVDGAGAPDYRYGYDRGLADGVVRAVFFPRRGGNMEWTAPDGYKRNATFDDPLADREAQHRLRTALSPTGEWLPSVLKDADQQLAELREADPEAGGIVFCEDSNGARAVRDMLIALGRDPVLAITEEVEADERIKTFRNSSQPWIVSIRKVSEGVDIPRLRVGVYATPWLTDMFFRQVVGRMVRVRPQEEDSTAYLFIPDDPRLRTMAEQIKEQRDHVLDQQEAELLGEREDGQESGLDGSIFSPISAIATDEGMIVDSETVSPAEMAQAEQVKRMSPDTAQMPTALVARLLRNAGTAAPPAPEPEPEEPTERPQYERKGDLRQANNKLVARITKSLGLEYREVGAKLNRAVGLPPKRGVHQASVEQLERRLQLGQEWLQTGTPPEVEG